MKTKSFFTFMLFAAAIVFASPILTSCGDDDDEDSNQNPAETPTEVPTPTSPLVGTWVNVENIQMSTDDAIVIWAFYNDGQVLFADQFYTETKQLDFAHGLIGKYEVNGNQLKINVTKVGHFDGGWMSEPQWQATSGVDQYTFEIMEPGTGVTKDYTELHLKKGENEEVIFVKREIDESFIANYKKQFD